MNFSSTVYVQDRAALIKFHAELKSRSCPHCKQTGFLIFNGSLSGYTDKEVERKTRGQRVYCSKRSRLKRGCGQTFSILFSFLFTGRIISTPVVSLFISLVTTGKSRRAAWMEAAPRWPLESGYRIWRTWMASQTHLRSWLARRLAPPEAGHDPSSQSWRHLVLVFPDEACPISAFQTEFQQPFFPKSDPMKTTSTVCL